MGDWITLIITGGYVVLVPMVIGIGYTARRVLNRRARARQRRDSLRRLAALRDQLKSSSLVRSREIRAPGLVQLEGRVTGGELLAAPLSGRPVVGYRFRIEEVGAENLVQVDVAHMNRFALDDGGGSSVEVRPSRCLPLLTPEPPREVSFAELSGAPLTQLIDRYPIVHAGVVGMARFRLIEYLLEPGETVFVYGQARLCEPSADAAEGYRDSRWPLVIEPPGEDGLLAISDRERETILTLDLEALMAMAPGDPGKDPS